MRFERLVLGVLVVAACSKDGVGTEVEELARGCGLAGSAWIESSGKLPAGEARAAGDAAEKELILGCKTGEPVAKCCAAGKAVDARLDKLGGKVAACEKLRARLQSLGC